MDFIPEQLAKILIEGGLSFFVVSVLLYLFKQYLDTMLDEIPKQLNIINQSLNSLNNSVCTLERTVGNDFQDTVKELSKTITRFSANMELTNKLMLELRKELEER